MKNGFTLIELIVTLSIIVMFMAIGIPSFRYSQAQAEVSASAENIKAAILRTYSYSLNSRPEDIRARSYSIVFPANSSTYETRVNRWNALSNDYETVTIETFNLEAGVILSNATPITITFSTPSGLANNASISIQHQNFSGVTKTINFNANNKQVTIQ